MRDWLAFVVAVMASVIIARFPIGWSGRGTTDSMLERLVLVVGRLQSCFSIFIHGYRLICSIKQILRAKSDFNDHRHGLVAQTLDIAFFQTLHNLFNLLTVLPNHNHYLRVPVCTKSTKD